MISACCQPFGLQRSILESQGNPDLPPTSTIAPKSFASGCLSSLSGSSSSSRKPLVPIRASSSSSAARGAQGEALQSHSSIVSDRNVPEGHRGLHGFLYGDQGADVHDAEPQPSVDDDGRSVEPFEDYVDRREGSRFSGVYSVYDSRNEVQYVGYSRNVTVSLRSHLHKLGKEKCSSVRVKVYNDAAMITRSKLEDERGKWLSVLDKLPPGNSSEKDLWEGTSNGVVMSEIEKIEYEEKKLKMRKAMGENLYDDVEGEEDDSRTRRLKLLQATEGDDWSDVIDGQTKDTIRSEQKDRVLNGEKKGGDEDRAIVSPFDENQNAGSSGSKGLYSAETFELNVGNVDMVLNDVRPYLIADGGNVEVVSVEDGIVSLRLQGACGTCPSSTVTMKMGIERVLKEKFADAVREVVQVGQQQIGATVQGIDAHLEILRPAIHNYGGFVEVLSVDSGVCKIRFKGPHPISMGIQAAIKDKFPDVASVEIEAAEA